MFKIKRVSDCTFTDLTNVWNEAFSNYIVSMKSSVNQISGMMGKKDLLPSSSFVIYDGNRPIGFFLNAIKTINGVKVAWNGGTGVDPSYQGRGIGHLLLEAAMDMYNKELVERATLEVLTDNLQGIKLYEKWGYKKTDIIDSFSIKNQVIMKESIKGNHRYSVKRGHAMEVKSLDFYNHKVAWESMC